MAEQFATLVAGEWRGSEADDWYPIHNPADTRELVGEFPSMGKGDIASIIESAHQGLVTWRATPILARAEVLRKAANFVRGRHESIARDITREMGKTITEARVETTKTADFLDYYASLGRWPIGSLLADARDGAHVQVCREPRGVVLAIVPWNDPLITPARKLCPALISGNSVILKAAPEAPLSALHIGRALDDAGLPRGVLNIVTGADDEVSAELVKSDGFDAVTFTGSTEVGLELQKRLAGRNIPLQNEMGGKNAAIVCADADTDLAVEALMVGAFAQAGQRCTATSRVVVDESRYGPLVNRLTSRVNAIRVGPGLDEQTQMGPLISEPRLEEILSTVADSQGDGSAVAAGGRRLSQDFYANGYFVEPTLVADVRENSSLWQDELFGPVLGVMPTASIDDAIRVVNGSRYGLSASIFTRDLEVAYRFVDEVEAGCVAVNLPTAGWDVHMPFGGFKESGSAFKEQGINALEFYTHVKTVALKTRGI